MNLWGWMMRVVERWRPRAARHEGISAIERAAREAELRHWRQVERRVQRTAGLILRDRE